jgi:hypothetical protein
MQAHNRPNKYNAVNHFLCMNARIEEAMNSENFSARITENRALDQKIWALEALWGKIVFSGGAKEFLEFLKWLEGLWRKRQGSCRIWEFLGIFMEFGWSRVIWDLFVITFRN